MVSTTLLVSSRTVSWIRDDAAALPPSTAKKALVIATAILLASKLVTLPLRRIMPKFTDGPKSARFAAAIGSSVGGTAKPSGLVS